MSAVTPPPPVASRQDISIDERIANIEGSKKILEKEKESADRTVRLRIMTEELERLRKLKKGAAVLAAKSPGAAAKRPFGKGRWTDYGGPNFNASTAKVYKQISKGGARAPRRPKSAPAFMGYEDENNDPNNTGMGYSGGRRSEMMETENKHAYMDKNWAGLPKVLSISKGVKLRNAHYKPKERY